MMGHVFGARLVAVLVVHVFWVCMCVTIAVAGWLHGVCVGAC